MAGRVVARGKVLDRLQLPHVKDTDAQNAFKMVLDAIYGLQDRRQTIVDTSSDTHLVNGVPTFANEVRLGSATGPLVKSGKGTPEAAVTAPVGSLYVRTDGGAGTTLYVKESGTGNTGWVAK